MWPFKTDAQSKINALNAKCDRLDNTMQKELDKGTAQGNHRASILQKQIEDLQNQVDILVAQLHREQL